jgi:hypothetical protein
MAKQMRLQICAAFATHDAPLLLVLDNDLHLYPDGSCELRNAGEMVLESEAQQVYSETLTAGVLNPSGVITDLQLVSPNSDHSRKPLAAPFEMSSKFRVSLLERPGHHPLERPRVA